MPHRVCDSISFEHFVAERKPTGGSDTRPWAKQICAAWQKTVENVVATSRLLIEAKGALPHGSFMAMIGTELPFSSRTAQRLMQIAEHPVLSDATHVSHLPASWGTLYELAQLPPQLLEQHIDDGVVHLKMERKDAQALLPGKSKAPPKSERRDAELRRQIEAQAAHIAELEAAREQPINDDIVEECGDLVEECLQLFGRMNASERSWFLGGLSNYPDISASLILGALDAMDENAFAQFVAGFNDRRRGFHISRGSVQ
jgi:hypothetical protein